ncbi:hypothetical protein GCM10010216_19980 [Streptomyces flaveolus]|nr:hypothetical protein GCM10010216_19980 [Streptomyces flaveolus]
MELRAASRTRWPGWAVAVAGLTGLRVAVVAEDAVPADRVAAGPVRAARLFHMRTLLPQTQARIMR